MKKFGYVLLLVGLVDWIISHALDGGSPLDAYTGAVAPYTAFILVGLGFFLVAKGGGDEE
jgi:hypothetical protein